MIGQAMTFENPAGKAPIGPGVGPAAPAAAAGEGIRPGRGWSG